MPKYRTLDKGIPPSLKNRDCQDFKLEFPGFSEKGKERILFICTHISKQDLEQGRLLGGENVAEAFYNLLHLSHDRSVIYARHREMEDIRSLEDYDIAFINFYFFKTYHLQDKNNEALKLANKISAARIKSYIRKTRPDKIFVFGDKTAKVLLNKDKVYHGWKYNYVVNGRDYPLYCTLDMGRLIPEEGKDNEYILSSNLIGYISKTIMPLWLNREPYSVRSVKPHYIYIDTIKKFRRMMVKLNATNNPIALDTETKDLTVISNKILTLQFALTHKEGYILPYLAKFSPFKASEFKEITQTLHDFFCRTDQTKNQYLIIHGAKFDIPLIRHTFKVPYLNWRVWDTIAGEVGLDENLVLLYKLFSISAWGLDAVFCRYYNDFYYTASFSKANRANMENAEPTKDLFRYESMDVQSLQAIHQMQLKRAADIPYRGEYYLEHYKRFILNQMSAMVKVISEMIYRGNPLDMNWLFKLYCKDSPIKKLREEIIRNLYKRSSVKKANRRLLRQQGIPKQGLFNKATTWIFNIEKQEHKKLLYLDILQLIPVSYGKWKIKKGTKKKYREASLDKGFQKKYEDVKEVAILSRLNELKTLYGTFCKGIYISAVNDPDIKQDMCLRPKYGYEDVVTGRSNSYGPSLQQIPEKKKEAKYIKRMFITPPKHLFIKLDYSTHEVRGWDIVSGDKILASLFSKAKEYILKYRQAPTAENKKNVEEKADIHKLNYALFTGTRIEEVTAQQRKESKGLGFGTIYGMGPASMARQIGRDETYTKKIQRKFFSIYKRAAKWLQLMREFARKNLYAYSLIGRMRNLSGYLLNNKVISGALGRKATNSPIQGFCSDIAYYAAELIMKNINIYYKRKGIDLNDKGLLPAGIVQQVHDALKFIVPYDDFIPLLRIIEYTATIGTIRDIEEKFGIKFTTQIAVDFEIGATGDTLQKWDWSEESLWRCVRDSLKVQREELNYPIKIKKVLRRIYNEARCNEKFLLKHYPLDIDKYKANIVENPLS